MIGVRQKDRFAGENQCDIFRRNLTNNLFGGEEHFQINN